MSARNASEWSVVILISAWSWPLFSQASLMRRSRSRAEAPLNETAAIDLGKATWASSQQTRSSIVNDLPVRGPAMVRTCSRGSCAAAYCALTASASFDLLNSIVRA